AGSLSCGCGTPARGRSPCTCPPARRGPPLAPAAPRRARRLWPGAAARPCSAPAPGSSSSSGGWPPPRAAGSRAAPRAGRRAACWRRRTSASRARPAATTGARRCWRRGGCLPPHGAARRRPRPRRSPRAALRALGLRGLGEAGARLPRPRQCGSRRRPHGRQRPHLARALRAGLCRQTPSESTVGSFCRRLPAGRVLGVRGAGGRGAHIPDALLAVQAHAHPAASFLALSQWPGPVWQWQELVRSGMSSHR
ncbi:unnamed protein product, partial [Prorocentrum cordatum]